MCEPISLGVASAASGALGAVGKYQSGQAQAAAQNAQNTNIFRQQLAVRRAEYDRERGLFQYRKSVYDQQLDENNTALDLAYQAEQQRLNNLFDTAAFSNQADLIEAMTAVGSSRARGVSGQSAQRAATSTLSALGRNQAIRAQELVSARQAYTTRTDNLRRRALSSNIRARNQVGLPPVPGVPPVAPIKAQGPSGLTLAADLGGAALSGFSAYQQYQAPDPGTIPTDPFGFL